MNPLLDFSTALQLVKLGDKIARQGWKRMGMYVFLVKDDNPLNKKTTEILGVDQSPYLAIKMPDNSRIPWLASQADILAEDWTVITE